MDELVKKSKDFLDERYKKPMHTVAAALETGSGNVYLGVNIDHFSGYVCAETSALATAINAGETVFNQIASMRREPDGQTSVANPCGKCLQILHDYARGIKIAVTDGKEIQVKTVEELLPFSFKRQRQKIEEALNNENASEVIG